MLPYKINSERMTERKILQNVKLKLISSFHFRKAAILFPWERKRIQAINVGLQYAP